MEKIDLTKCNNCRFRLRIDGTNYFGRIGTDERGRNCLFCDDGKAYWIADSSDELQRYGKSDFSIVPRDPETYRDWQVGDVVYNLDDEGNTVSGEDEICRVIFRSGELVAIAENCSVEDSDARGCYTCSQLFREGWRLVLTDIETRIIEKKKKYEPQDGDVCYVKSSSGYYAIFIYNRYKWNEKTGFYVSFDSRGNLFYSGYAVNHRDIEELRPATDEEKQRLFDAMAKKGKRWNAEKKVVEDIPKPYEFKKGEPVLVRNNKDRWIIAVFNEIADDPDYQYMAFNGEYLVEYKHCIPYNERTMHLLGTNEDYKEE